MIDLLEKSHGTMLGFRLAGQVSGQDYRTFAPAVDTVLIARGAVRLLIHFDHVDGRDLADIWDELKFDPRYYSRVERVAVLAEPDRKPLLLPLLRPFVRAEVRVFTATETDAAWRWLEQTDDA